jgi:hypothetical protein
LTTVIPFKGNFAEYHHLEIAKPVSLVGKALTPDVASRQVAKFKSQFESRGLFETVAVIDAYDPATASQHRQQSSANGPSEKSDDVDRGEALDAPIGSFDDLIARDKRRTFGEDAGQRPAADKTLVVVIEVIDYAKGSRLEAGAASRPRQVHPHCPHALLPKEHGRRSRATGHLRAIGWIKPARPAFHLVWFKWCGRWLH